MKEPSSSAGENQRFRALLPLPPRTGRPPAQPPDNTRRRDGRTRIACEPCRKNKTKCSGDQPRCQECIKRDLVCDYEVQPTETRLQGLKRKVQELEKRKSPYEKFFELLSVVPEPDAQRIFKRVRSGADVDTILRQVADGDLRSQLSVAPETRYRYNFPYISKMPASLVTDDNPYLRSFVHEAAAIYSVSEHYLDLLRDSTPYVQRIGDVDYSAAYQKPFHAALVVEPRLSQVSISYWTDVCDDDVLMRDVLGAWFQNEYFFTSILQKDLFLDDMAAKRHDFCSPLLVNILLAYACVCYPQFPDRARYWDPRTWTYHFLEEAKRLWTLAYDDPYVTTIQAGVLFNCFYGLCGMDEVGQTYRMQALPLARRMDLFSSSKCVSKDPRIRHGMAYTAWALFTWESLVAFSFMFYPQLTEPPDWHLPEPEKVPDWYGEVWLRYPLSNHLIPSHLGKVIYAKIHFRAIMNDACQIAYSDTEKMTLGKANELLSRLRSWYNALPDPLRPRSIVLPIHLQLHAYYHHLVITIFKPLLNDDSHRGLSPRRIVDDASKNLQTIIRLYYLRHGFDAMDTFLVQPLALAAYDCLDLIHEHTPPSELETLRSTLILVAKGIYSQRKNHHLADALFRVIRGRMRPAEASLFKGVIDVDEVDESPEMAQMVRSHWPITVAKGGEDAEAYELANLVKDYAHLNVE